MTNKMRTRIKCYEGYKCKKHTCCKHRHSYKKRINKNTAKKKRSRNVKKNKKNITNPICRREGPTQYVIYSIINTDYSTNKGCIAASVARALLYLGSNAYSNKVKSKAWENWESHGEKIILLTGLNHKHLIFLQKQVRWVSVDTYILYHTWGRNKVALVLTILATPEEIEEILDGLSFYK